MTVVRSGRAEVRCVDAHQLRADQVENRLTLVTTWFLCVTPVLYRWNISVAVCCWCCHWKMHRKTSQSCMSYKLSEFLHYSDDEWKWETRHYSKKHCVWVLIQPFLWHYICTALMKSLILHLINVRGTLRVLKCFCFFLLVLHLVRRLCKVLPFELTKHPWSSFYRKMDYSRQPNILAVSVLEMKHDICFYEPYDSS